MLYNTQYSYQVNFSVALFSYSSRFGIHNISGNHISHVIPSSVVGVFLPDSHRDQSQRHPRLHAAYCLLSGGPLPNARTPTLQDVLVVCDLRVDFHLLPVSFNSGKSNNRNVN